MIRIGLWFLLAALGAAIECGPDYQAVLGKPVGRGARGRVVVISGKGIPENSVVKIYEPQYEAPYSKEKVEGFAARYALIHKLLGARCVEPRGVIETEPGKFGLVMSRIPDEERIYNPEWANDTTVQDLQAIKAKLLENKLGITDFSFTILKDGHVVLYDLDYVYSAEAGSPFYHAERASKYPGALSNLDTWIEYVKLDIAAKRKKGGK